MFITKKAISRRTLLRGIGTTLALPLLDGMVPALTALQKGIGVSTTPGWTELTRMPCGASSIAQALVIPSTACFIAQ